MWRVCGRPVEAHIAICFLASSAEKWAKMGQTVEHRRLIQTMTATTKRTTRTRRPPGRNQAKPRFLVAWSCIVSIENTSVGLKGCMGSEVVFNALCGGGRRRLCWDRTTLLAAPESCMHNQHTHRSINRLTGSRIQTETPISQTYKTAATAPAPDVLARRPISRPTGGPPNLSLPRIYLHPAGPAAASESATASSPGAMGCGTFWHQFKVS